MESGAKRLLRTKAENMMSLVYTTTVAAVVAVAVAVAVAGGSNASGARGE